MHTLLDTEDLEALEEKPFLIIEIPREAMDKYLGSPGICDNCSEMPEVGVYIAVLNHWDCPKCFKKWLHWATYYPDDREIEEKNYARTCRSLGLEPILN